MGLIGRLDIHLAGEARIWPVNVDEHKELEQQKENRQQIACNCIDMSVVACCDTVWWCADVRSMRKALSMIRKAL